MAVVGCWAAQVDHDLALYRGGIDLEVVLQDARELVGIDLRTRWHLAKPLPVNWFTNPPAEDYALDLIRAMMKNRETGALWRGFEETFSVLSPRLQS